MQQEGREQKKKKKNLQRGWNPKNSISFTNNPYKSIKANAFSYKKHDDAVVFINTSELTLDLMIVNLMHLKAPVFFNNSNGSVKIKDIDYACA